jgi:hypothetical protein
MVCWLSLRMRHLSHPSEHITHWARSCSPLPSHTYSVCVDTKGSISQGTDCFWQADAATACVAAGSSSSSGLSRGTSSSSRSGFSNSGAWVQTECTTAYRRTFSCFWNQLSPQRRGMHKNGSTRLMVGACSTILPCGWAAIIRRRRGKLTSARRAGRGGCLGVARSTDAGLPASSKLASCCTS